MQKTYSLFRSGTFYSIVLMFLIGGFSAISNAIPAGLETVIMGVLGLAASYFHLNLAQKMGAVN